MNNAVSPGLPVIYSSTWQNQQPLSASNLQVSSRIFSLSTANTASIQIFTDGGCAVDYLLQLTNLPSSLANFGSSIFGAVNRDDSFTSPHWDTTPSGGGTLAGSSLATRIVTLLLPTSVFRHGRVLFTYNAGGAGKVFAVLGTTEA